MPSRRHGSEQQRDERADGSRLSKLLAGGGRSRRRQAKLPVDTARGSYFCGLALIHSAQHGARARDPQQGTTSSHFRPPARH